MKIQVRNSLGEILATITMTDEHLQTNPTLLRLDVIDDSGRQARGFVAAKLIKQGIRFEIVGKKNDNHDENIGSALATFQSVKEKVA